LPRGYLFSGLSIRSPEVLPHVWIIVLTAHEFPEGNRLLREVGIYAVVPTDNSFKTQGTEDSHPRVYSIAQLAVEFSFCAGQAAAMPTGAVRVRKFAQRSLPIGELLISGSIGDFAIVAIVRPLVNVAATVVSATIPNSATIPPAAILALLACSEAILVSVAISILEGLHRSHPLLIAPSGLSPVQTLIIGSSSNCGDSDIQQSLTGKIPRRRWWVLSEQSSQARQYGYQQGYRDGYAKGRHEGREHNHS
jgi:hypothetical protein